MVKQLIKRAVEAFAGGTLAGLAVGLVPNASLPWQDALLVGVGCAVIAVLLALAGGPIFAKLRARRVERGTVGKDQLPTLSQTPVKPPPDDAKDTS